MKFKAHFNRVNMQRGNPRVWTVHTSKQCFQAEEIVIRVPVKSVFKPGARQPRAYFEGYAKRVYFDGSSVVVL